MNQLSNTSMFAAGRSLKRLTMMLLLLSQISIVPVVSGQTTIDLRTQSRNPDFSAMPVTRPFTVGGLLPSTCVVGQLMFDNVVTAGSNLYECTATNTWTSSGGASAMTLPLPIVSGGTGTATPSLIAGSNVFIAGAWPNQTVSTTGSASPVGPAGGGLTGTYPGPFLAPYNSGATNAVSRTIPSKLGDWVSAADFGAIPSGSTDNYQYLQNAINTECAATGGVAGPGASLYVPGGLSAYLISKPLVVGCSNLRVSGQSLATRITPTYAYGPAIVVRPANPAYPVFPSSNALVGTGSAMSIGPSGAYLDLNEIIQSGSMNGLSSFTLEADVSVSTTIGDASFIDSSGQKGSGPQSESIGLKMISGGQVYGVANISGTDHSLFSTSNITAGTTYHLALSYDGSTLRFFVNGVVESSLAIAGTLTQTTTETFSVGPQLQNWPAGAVYISSATGVIDNIRVSNNARYIANFAPPTDKFSADGNVLALLTFQSQFDSFTQGQSSVGRGWLMARFPFTNSLSDVHLEDLAVYQNATNDGIIGYWAINSHFDRLEVENGYRGISMENNCYESSIEYAEIRGATEWDILLANASGVFRVNRPVIIGGVYQIVVNGDVSANISDAYLQTESNTIEALVIDGFGSPQDKVELNNVITDSESGGSSLMDLLYTSNVGGTLSVKDSYFEAPSRVRAITVQGGNQINIYNSTLAGSSGANANINIVSPPNVPINYLAGNIRSSTSQPLSNNPASVRDWSSVIILGQNRVASSAIPAFNLSLGKYQLNTLAANVTSFTVTNITSGGEWCFDFAQDGVGGRTISGVPSAMHGFFIVGASAQKHNLQCFYSPDGANLYAESGGVINQ